MGWLFGQLVWPEAKFCWVNASHHGVSFSRLIAAGDQAGMFWACEIELIAKLIHRARQVRWGLNISLAETRDELGYQELP